jgi:hypothetical protein
VDKANIGSTGISPASITGQSYDGSFEVTFKDYKNTQHSATLKGTISFNFGKTTYFYSGEIANASDEPTGTVVHDQGTYSLDGDIIKLADDATKMMHAQWMPSLYLAGDYSYTHMGDVIVIEGNGRFGALKITLKTSAVGIHP